CSLAGLRRARSTIITSPTLVHSIPPIWRSNRVAAPVLPSAPLTILAAPDPSRRLRIPRDDQITIGRPRQHREPPRGFLLRALSDAPDACRPSLSLGPCRQASR